jgi:hypothetical protein
MPITNLVIILFVLAMIYMGTVQGLFSSFLHLMVVIAAGALAFAVWEPLTLGLLMKHIPLMAWTIGLLVPFGVLLLILRMACDKLVPANAQMPGLANLLLGGACGMLSGILTAGVAVIGIGFLPFGPDLGGVQPYAVGRSGIIQDTDTKFWVPVHSLTANFYSGLSRGAFATKTPMAEYKPHLDVQSSLVRLRPDFVSIVAAPEAVNVTGAYIAEVSTLAGASPATAEALGSDFTRAGYKLVLIDTDWSKVEGTVDGDRALRLPASQVRLITKSTEGKEVELAGPVGFSKLEGENRVFYPYDTESQVAFSTAPNSTFGFVYLIPADQQPLFPIIRNLRLEMPDDVNSEPDAVLAALGNPPVPTAAPEGEEGTEGAGEAAAAQGETAIGDRTGIRAGTYALDLEVTNRLPRTASKNTITGLSFTDTDDGAMVTTGSTGSARKPVGTVGARNKIVGFNIPDHEAMVRVRLNRDVNQTILGAGLSSAASLYPIFLKDTQGNQWPPTAWVWQKEDGDQEIHYDAFDTIRNAKQLPLSRKGDGDDFYLYFTVTKPATLVSYNIGDVSAQPCEPPLREE